MLHQAVRMMTASHLAAWQGRATVSARELYCGTECTDAFTQREFEPVLALNMLPSVDLVPWPSVTDKTVKRKRAVPHIIPLQNGSKIDLTSDVCGNFVVHMGARNALQRIWVRAGSARQRALAVIDAKCATADADGRLTEELVDSLVKKRRALSKRLEMNVLAVFVSMFGRKEKPDEVSEWLQKKLGRLDVCCECVR